MSKSYTLLTGATGLVGRYLVRDLLLSKVRLAVLVRPGKKQTAHERIESVLQHWENELGESLPRPIVLTGDVNQADLGLSEADVQWLSENCDHVIHNAAVLTFQGGREQEPWRTNYHGTSNVIELAKRIQAGNWHYVSTAYVCGRRNGVISEDELKGEHGFRNDYEESKFESETMIRKAAEGVAKLTVYRPAVIIGDSKTGFTTSYHGLFLYLRLIATLVPGQPRDENGVIQTPVSLPISGDEPRNLVPVDWVSAAITQLFLQQAAHGRTFHLAPEKRTTSREIIDYCYEYFNTSGVVYAGEDSSEEAEVEPNRFHEIFVENSRAYEAYYTEDPTFDRSNLQSHLDLPCPEVDCEMIHRFIEFGTGDQWGKKRKPAREVPCWFGEKLMNISEFEFLSPVKNAVLGIDIHGPGGGQWRILIDGDSRRVERGLPGDSAPVITLDAEELNKKVSESRETGDNFWQSVFLDSNRLISMLDN